MNDGKSLESVADGSVDFIFSFDSLVHPEDSALKSYAAEFAKKLRPDGVVFIHHSNLGDYARRMKLQNRLSKIPKLLNALTALGVCEDLTTPWRAPTMTAAKMVTFAEENELECISQELVNWSTRFALIDCLSTLVRRGSRRSRRNHILRNPTFMLEADRLSVLSTLYRWTPET